MVPAFATICSPPSRCWRDDATRMSPWPPVRLAASTFCSYFSAIPASDARSSYSTRQRHPRRRRRNIGRFPCLRLDRPSAIRVPPDGVGRCRRRLPGALLSGRLLCGLAAGDQHDPGDGAPRPGRRGRLSTCYRGRERYRNRPWVALHGALRTARGPALSSVGVSGDDRRRPGARALSRANGGG